MDVAEIDLTLTLDLFGDIDKLIDLTLSGLNAFESNAELLPEIDSEV